MRLCLFTAFSLAFTVAGLSGQTVSPLYARGYTVLPSPQRVHLAPDDFVLDASWRITGSAAVEASGSELKRSLRERFGVTLTGRGPNAIELLVAPGAASPAPARDQNSRAIAEQAYRISLTPARVVITGNSSTGLYYGVQTFIQLLKQSRGTLQLPEGEIEDWPDLELRIIYWDDAHHLDHLDVLKAAVRQASFYKINAFAIKLEGHFEYAHAKPIVEPYALSRTEFQQLTDYALAHHVQVIPYLDGPAHDSFILKHPEYRKLRAFPASNYEFCTTNPTTYQLFDGMFDDLIAANQGGKYFLLSTDEPYYVGLANNSQCNEAERARQLGSRGKVLAEFTTKTARHLEERGRKVIFWGEYPLKPDDISALPNDLVNGETYGPEFDRAFRDHGIRQMAYTYVQGEEPLFPQYSSLPNSERLHRSEIQSGRIREILDTVTTAKAGPSDLIGIVVAGWADAGLHPETFWRGYVAGASAGWRTGLDSDELAGTFDALFYGSRAIDMGRVYQLMSQGAEFWQDSWETGPSKARKPIWGDSNEIFKNAHPAKDQFLPPLPVPQPKTLRINANWRNGNAKRLYLAERFLAQNQELSDLLLENMRRVEFNRYNLEVFLSIARLYRQNLLMIGDLARISDALQTASRQASAGDAKSALASLDSALDISIAIRRKRDRVLSDTTETWYRSWFPRVAEANGRKVANEADDVKDHLPARTIDMSYLVYRELLYPMQEWMDATESIRNDYAAAHDLPQRAVRFEWSSLQ